MSMQVTVALDAQGPIAVKTATGASDIARLRLEAERLERAAHPGLVSVVAPVQAGAVDRSQAHGHADVELRTRFAGDPVSHWTGSVSSVAGLGAAVAATLADLHDIGVVHGRLDPTHILVGDDGRPRLCGLSHPGGAERQDDVAALGRVLGEVLDRAPADRGRWRPWLGGSGAAHRRALEQVIARAVDPVPSRRPNARLLASSILAAVPGAELPGSPVPPRAEPAYVPPDEELLDLVFTHELTDDERWAQVFGDDPPEPAEVVERESLPPPEPAWPGPEPGGVPVRPVAATAPEPGDRSSRARLAAGSGALAAVAIAAGAVVVGGWGSPGSVARPAAVQATTRTGRAECPAIDPPAADVDGDGCPEALVVEDGTISAGAARWILGEPGDLVAVGDWDCDGRAAPALLRPATGDVFVFPRWAAESEPLTVEARDRLPGAVGIQAQPAEEGCHDLVVDLGSGATTTVEVRR
jgi:hypothetical protein